MASSFLAKVELFKREKGWYYVAVPIELTKPLIHLSDRGLIAITATVGNCTWNTSLLPMGDGTHFIALPAKIRKKENVFLNQEIKVLFKIRVREKQ